MALLGGTSAPASAQTNTLTVLAVEDAYISESMPEFNRGALSDLRVDSEPVMQTYLKFEVTGAPQTVASATLQVFARSAHPAGVTVSTTSSSWAEESVTFTASREPREAVADTGEVTAESWIEVDVSHLVTGDGTYSFVLTSSDPQSLTMASREAGEETAPRLVLAAGDPTATSTATFTPSPTATFTPTATSSPTPTKTAVPPTATATATKTATATATKTPSPTNTPLPPTATPTATKTATPTATATATHTPSPTATATHTPSPTATATKTPWPTATPTKTPSPTATPTMTPSPTPSPTAVPSFPEGSPIRAAFYYPWFPEAWNQQGFNPFTKYTPSLGYYDASDAVTQQHIQAMQYGKIDAGISSWWGPGHRTDTRFPALLRNAHGTGFKWALYQEAEGQRDQSIAEIEADLRYIRDNYANDPSYLWVDGKFVVFVYGQATDKCGMAERWVRASESFDAYIVLKVFTGFRNCEYQPESWHQYAPANAVSHQSGYSYAVAPGFFKPGEQERLARDIDRWNQNVRDMVASGERWQLVQTFNEWGEGTSVESAVQWASSSGYGAYLDALRNDGQVQADAPSMAVDPPAMTPTPTAAPPQPTSHARPWKWRWLFSYGASRDESTIRSVPGVTNHVTQLVAKMLAKGWR